MEVALSVLGWVGFAVLVLMYGHERDKRKKFETIVAMLRDNDHQLGEELTVLWGNAKKYDTFYGYEIRSK